MKAPHVKGTTLIETLIYVAIFSFFVVSLISFSVGMTSSRLNNQIILEVNYQGSRAINVITQALRNADSVVEPAVGVVGSSLNITTDSPATNPTVFYLSDGVMYVSEGGMQPIALTNDKITISNLFFSNLSVVSKPSTIQIRFTASNSVANARPEENYKSNFYGTASFRK